MRFRRRDASAEDTLAAAAASRPRMSAEFAGVLDGRRLWVGVHTRPGRLALRRDGVVLDLPDDAPLDDSYLTARLDLVDLPAEAASYDVVRVDGDSVTTLWIAPLEPRRTPLAPGGRCRHRVARGDDGTLRLETEVVADAVELASVSLGPDGIRLGVGGPVRLVGDDGTTVASWPDALLTPDAVADLAAQQTRVLAGDLPVRRRADDLSDPGRGAPLPGTGRLRLRWSAHGLLQARVTDKAVDGT